MARGEVREPIFKAYHQHQIMLLPPSLDELIGVNHPVRVVNEVLNKIDIQPLIRKYRTGGASNYHPQMLLKVLVYAYMNNVYSSRKIEEALQQNIHYMWLSGMSTPDHNTINRFRGEKLKEPLRNIFTEVVLLLAEEGLLSIKELYTDGTKIESAANKYSFVWGNSIKTNRSKIKQQVDELWGYAQSVASSELEDPEPTDFEKITSEKVKATIEKIDAVLKDKPEVSKAIKQKLNYGKKHWPEALDRYEAQEKIMGENRNSYSKTDTDATFMRMKEDHMLNGQLKPAYNIQISTNNQYVTNYSTHQSTTDTTTLTAHLEQYKEQYQAMPAVVTADAGYGSEENYQYLQDNNIEAYVKYNHFDREQHSTTQDKKPFTADKLYYNAQQDYYVCPMGQRMHKLYTQTKETKNGYKQTVTKYGGVNCSRCPLNGVCHKSKSNRVIEVNHHLNSLKQAAKEKLQTELGIYHRKKRCADVEPVFANIKSNHQFKRFKLRGMEKVTIEIGLLSLAHNLRKKTKHTSRQSYPITQKAA
ncbi:MAG: IS1182 family transposase [Bacteroidetes bacterium]|nr:MAG: IS1182 family transposase [Bacteroidota bacterium]